MNEISVGGWQFLIFLTRGVILGILGLGCLMLQFFGRIFHESINLQFPRQVNKSKMTGAPGL
jgi:hypothetical protein